MNLDDLQSIQNRERQTDSLQPLPGSFYAEAGTYLAELRQKRAAVASERGFDDPEFRRLSDEIDAVEDTVVSIYERRVGKVVKAASFAAADMPAEDDGLTDEERALYQTLVDDITANRQRVLEELATEPEDGGDHTHDSDEPVGEQADPDDGDVPTDEDSLSPPPQDSPNGPANDGATEPHPEQGRDEGGHGNDEPNSSPTETDGDVPRTMLRITRDVGEILGVDERAYDLARGDVVTLPEENAGPLLDRDAATRLE